MWRALRWLGVIGVIAALAAVGSVGYVWTTTSIDTIGRVTFSQPLAIPPLAESRIDADGVRVFELTARSGTSEFLPGTSAKTWGFNGAYLGPTLRAQRGERVRINVHNDLDEATTVHWHGMHLPPEMDGGPHQVIEPGSDWSPSWEIDQPAATLWYHPHPHGRSRDQVRRGLAGMFILDDPAAQITTALPNEYGVDDIPVIVQDRSLSSSDGDDDGSPDALLINGTHGPYLDVTTQSVRLRLLNASVARVYNFGFSDDRSFALIASDGGLLPAPAPVERVALSPGERAEIVIDLRPAEVVILRSYPPDLGEDWFTAQFERGSDRFDVLQLRAARDLAASAELPEQLAPAPDLVAPSEARPVDRRFELRSSAINGREMDMARIDEAVEVDTTEVWEIENTDTIYHSFHVHDVQFQVLEVDGVPPPAEYAGWKDTVLVPAGGSVRLALHFSDYTDPDVPYMFHCHRLRHEDRGMMGQFVVVEPGQRAGTPPAHQGH